MSELLRGDIRCGPAVCEGAVVVLGRDKQVRCAYPHPRYQALHTYERAAPHALGT